MEAGRKKTLKAIFRAGVEAVDPEKAVRAHVWLEGRRLDAGGEGYLLDRFERVHVFGAGKGAAPMAVALEDIIGDRLAGGLIVVKYGHGLPLKKTEVIEAGHPIPDEAGVAGANRLLDRLSGLTERDLVLFVLSGGGSALLPLPQPPVDLAAKQQTTRLLLRCGATIREINAVRKHLSRVKGGRLAAAAHPAACVSLVLSDVIGDPLDAIASGPTVPDTSTFEDCLEIIDRYAVREGLPRVVLEVLEEGAEGRRPETPKPDHPVFVTARNVIVANNRTALQAAGRRAEQMGYHTLVLTSGVEGQARDVAVVLAVVGKEIAESGRPVRPPACVLAGGETTVTVTGSGKGGRNQELALAAAIALDGTERIWLLSAGTDGTDGPTDAAGAFADGSTCRSGLEKGLDPRRALEANDAYTFFDGIGDLLITGPTRTNVMDLICLLVK